MEIPTSVIHKQPARRFFFNMLLDNPIIAKELKGRMRGRQGFVLLTAYLGLISLVIASVYLYSIPRGNTFNSPDALQDLGKQTFQIVVVLELLMIVFIGPALTSGAISSERERGTFDLLRTSLLSSRSLVLGKLGSAVVYLLLLILAALPLQSMAFFLGGVDIAEMLVSLVILVVSTLLFCTLGLYFSSLVKRTIISTVLSYTALIFPNIALVVMFYMLINYGVGVSSLSLEDQMSVLFIIWILISINPFIAAYVTEMMLVEEQSLFLIQAPDMPFVLFSPWILYVIFSITMTILMIWLIVFYLNRYER